MEQTAKLNWQRVRTIFEDALLLPPGERRHYAKELCGKDESIWVEVSELFDSYEDSDAFLEVPAVVHAVQNIRGNENQLTAGQRLLHYEIRELIGAGGMGEVYLARDTRLGRNVAVKLLRQDLLPHFRAGDRLLREARASAMLEHPNICQIHEISEVDGFSFIVMQYVVGMTLDEILSGRGVDAATALDIAGQVAEGLAEAHRQGIVHRDIKPANIIVSDKGHVKILDFGLAKFLEAESRVDAASRMESTGGVMGTVPYMSPEQLLGTPVDARTDVFSFGAMLFEMLCGVSAFGRKSNEETISAILNAEPDWSLLPPSLRRVLQKCLAKDPSDRFASAREVAEVLTEAGKSVPITKPKKLKKSRTTDQQSSDAATEPAEVLTQASYTWRSAGKELSEPVPQKLWINVNSIALYAMLVILVAGSAYGGYFLYTKYNSSETGSAAVKEVRLIPFRKGDKFGFCDENKKLVIEAKYDYVRPFSEGLAIVNIGSKIREINGEYSWGKTGAIDPTGREVIPLKYDSIMDFKDGLAIVSVDALDAGGNRGGKVGLIARSGREIVPPQYDQINEFVDGFAEVTLNKQSGYIDQKGKIAIPLVYGEPSKHYSSGLAAVYKGGEQYISDSFEIYEPIKGKYGYIDMAGQEAVPFKFDKAGPFSTDEETSKSLAYVWIDKQCGYIDLKGEFEISPKFAACSSFSEGLASVLVNKKWGFLDTNGNEVIPPKYDMANDFHEGLAAVAIGKTFENFRWGFINKSGEEVVQTKYFVTGPLRFQNGRAYVCLSTGEYRTDDPKLPKLRCGFIDKNGNEVIPLKYEGGRWLYFSDDLAFVTFDGKDFYIDRNGVEYYEPDTGPTQQTSSELTESLTSGQTPFPNRLIAIPGGTFRMRSSNDVKYLEAVKPFRMQETEVSNAEYFEFVGTMGYKPIPEHWMNGEPIPGQERMPVRFVNRNDIDAFISWRSKRDAVNYRLPTEVEWEYAASNGAKENLYPWGDYFKGVRCAWTDQGDPTPVPVGTHSCPNDWGIYDLIGNVWEWTSSGPEEQVPSLFAKSYAIRGGSAVSSVSGSTEPRATSTVKRFVPADTRDKELGFRLVTSD